MKNLKKIWISIFLLLLATVIVLTVCYIYPALQKTPDEIVEIEKQKTQAAYKENLDTALALVNQYEFVVLLNPAHGGMDIGEQNDYGNEKDIALAVCQKIMEANQDSKVGIFLTRTKDVGMDWALRFSVAEQIQPDLFVDIHVDKNGAGGISVAYDTTYYNRKLTNAEFADIMEKSVVSAVEGYATGIIDVTDTEERVALKDFTIPAVSISCGDMSGKPEGELLVMDNYQLNLAKGILDGIYEARKQLE